MRWRLAQPLATKRRSEGWAQIPTATNDKARVHPASLKSKWPSVTEPCSHHVDKIRIPSRLCKARCCALPLVGREGSSGCSALPSIGWRNVTYLVESDLRACAIHFPWRTSILRMSLGGASDVAIKGRTPQGSVFFIPLAVLSCVVLGVDHGAYSAGQGNRRVAAGL